MLFVAVVLFVATFTLGVAEREVLQNPGFESPLRGHWESQGFRISRSSDAHSGSYSLKCSERTHSKSGPQQLVHLTPGKMYKFSAYTKQLNDMPGTMFQHYNVYLIATYRDNGEHFKHRIVRHTMVRSVDGWFKMVGFYRAPARALWETKILINKPDISIKFLLDDVSLMELDDLPGDWKEDANRRITQLRMGNIHFRFNLSPGVRADDIHVQIDHVKHHFGFGTLVNDRTMIDPHYKRYQDFVYDNFNTATTQGIKWKFNKGTQHHPDYTDTMACVDALRQKGMLVRGHNLLWGFTKSVPHEVQNMHGAQLKAVTEEHYHYMLNITRGKLDHLDVMNENIHGQLFEKEFNDPLYTEKLFTEIKRLNPKPLLMLNDFAIVPRPTVTSAYLHQAQRFLSHGVPLQALGIQGHFHDTVIDPQKIMLALDLIAEAGLPLWFTEVDVRYDDVNVRADSYEAVLRILFSYPSVDGIVLWGFWDQQVVDRRSSLVDGDSFTVNAAGHRVFNLIKDTWSTHVNRSLSSGANFDLLGFKGDYKVTVKRNGVNVKVVPFTLTGNSTNVHINI